MYEPIVVRPAADPVKPRFEHGKLRIAALRIEPFEQEHGSHFFLEHLAGEQLVRDLSQKCKIVLAQNLASAAPNGAP